MGFEPTTSAGERPQTYALDRAATGTGGTVTCYLFEITDSDVIQVKKITNRVRYILFLYYRFNMFRLKWPPSGIAINP